MFRLIAIFRSHMGSFPYCSARDSTCRWNFANSRRGTHEYTDHCV